MDGRKDGWEGEKEQTGWNPDHENMHLEFPGSNGLNFFF